VGPRVVRHDRDLLVAAPVVSAGSAGNEKTVVTYGVRSPAPRYARGMDEKRRDGSLPGGLGPRARRAAGRSCSQRRASTGPPGGRRGRAPSTPASRRWPAIRGSSRWCGPRGSSRSSRASSRSRSSGRGGGGSPAGSCSPAPGAGGALLVLHGADFVAQGVLALGGFVHVPASVPLAAIRLSTFLWGPWFLLGGLLFCIAAWKARKGPGQGRRYTPTGGETTKPSERSTERLR
jgi:hypothetical protein